ncbi:MAG: hypothetical protein KGJ49_06735 [Alphaproteobacteria bacterium]|nr:hypothetical protein [Alphaproteobacteria bacterium]
MRARAFSGLFLLFALAFPAVAAERQAEHGPSLDRILPEIRRQTPGTFYDAQGPFIGPDGQARYRIKWMTPDGRIVWFDADARTGRLLGAVPVPGGPVNRFERYDDGRANPFGNFGGPGYDRGGRGNDGREDSGRGNPDRGGDGRD